MEAIYVIASKYANLDRETHWVLNQSFSDSIHFLRKEIAGRHKHQGWEFTTHLYNAVDSGECIKDRFYAVHLCR